MDKLTVLINDVSINSSPWAELGRFKFRQEGEVSVPRDMVPFTNINGYSHHRVGWDGYLLLNRDNSLDLAVIFHLYADLGLKVTVRDHHNLLLEVEGDAKVP